MDKVKTMYGVIFNNFLNDLETENAKSKIYEHFINLDWINKDYLRNSSEAAKVRDFIAGMTDRYFETTFKELVLPKRASKYINNI